MRREVELPPTQAEYLQAVMRASEEAQRLAYVAVGAALAGHGITPSKQSRFRLNGTVLEYSDDTPDPEKPTDG